MKYTSLLEKFGLALLVFAWLVYGSNRLGDMLVHANESGVEALRIVVPESAPASDAEPADMATEMAAVDFTEMMATADLAVGEKAFKKCKACHTIAEGGKNKVGPGLWNIVDRAKASVAGFAYSDALNELGGTWTIEDLNMFLESPKTWAPGNKMTYRGVPDAAKRAGLIAYLNAQSN